MNYTRNGVKMKKLATFVKAKRSKSFEKIKTNKCYIFEKIKRNNGRWIKKSRGMRHSSSDEMRVFDV